MRTTLALLLAAVGCSPPAESHGTTKKEYGGTLPVVFINATPERLCGLYISYENEAEYGDNWLPTNGLDVGDSLEFKIKPGTYKAKWNTCKDARDRPTLNYAATLVGGTAIPITEPLQLYAFVSDGIPPTKRGVPRPRMKMIKFIGQPTVIAAVEPTTPGAPPPEPEPAPPAEPPAPTQPFLAPIRAPMVVPPPPAPRVPVAPPAAPVAPPVAAPPPPPPPPPPPALGPPGSPLFRPK